MEFLEITFGIRVIELTNCLCTIAHRLLRNPRKSRKLQSQVNTYLMKET